MASGCFCDVEEVLLDALKGSEPQYPVRKPSASLSEMLARAREILEGEELRIERNLSPGRPVDLS